jgi:hypothetical protein
MHSGTLRSEIQVNCESATGLAIRVVAALKSDPPFRLRIPCPVSQNP